jgi:hypothetical protein
MSYKTRISFKTCDVTLYEGSRGMTIETSINTLITLSTIEEIERFKDMLIKSIERMKFKKGK